MKIYTKETNNKQKLKKPMIAFKQKKMLAVDENGKRLATLFDLEYMVVSPYAKKLLADRGYSTDWAEWDQNDCMTKLLEDFE